MTAAPSLTDEESARHQLLETLLRQPLDQLLRPSAGLRLEFETVGEEHVPLLINDGTSTARLAALVSPEGHYLAYPVVEAGRRATRSGAAILTPLLSALRLFARLTTFDRVVFVNHWLVMPGPSLRIFGADLDHLLERLQASYPDYALVFSGLIPAFDPRHGHLMRELTARGGKVLRRRTVYLFDPTRSLAGRHFRKQRYKIRTDIQRHDRAAGSMIGDRDELTDRAAEIRALYEQLYLGKHATGLNTNYGDSFFRIMLASPLVDSAAWEGPDGRLEAFSSAIHIDGRMPWTVCGYDSAAAQARGLFRLAYAHDLKVARATGEVLHLGAGNDEFKRHRGALPAHELDLVFHHHLSPRRRLPWFLLRQLRRPRLGQEDLVS